MNRFFQLMIVACGLAISASNANAARRYAKVSATGSGNCNTWADACTLSNAIVASTSGDQIWVMAGSYVPFELKEGVKIIGGFAGTEFSVLQSSPASNLTIVDGGGSQRTVYGANLGASTMLRGFKIINGIDADDKGGGGLMLSDSSALIVQCTFENNSASVMGGAVMVKGIGSPQFINCIFRNNGATSPSSPPYEGGAVFLTAISPVSFTNCLFHNNKAGGGGGVAKVPGTEAIFNNCTFADNQATMTRGGAISDESGAVSLRNCILWGNTRIQSGAPLADQIHSPGYGAKVQHSDIAGGWPGAGNINANPQFLNAAGGDYQLQSTSPCKNTGDTSALPADTGDLDWDTNTVEPLPTDLLLSGRIWDTTVDMGPYEYSEPESPE